MKKIKFVYLLFLTLIFACEDERLEISNQNEPTPDALNSEQGITRFALGIWDVDKGLGWNNTWFVQTNHSIMGDENYVPWGNFGWRYANQVESVILDDGTVVNSPIGNQKTELLNRNQRSFGDDNAMKWEWENMYLLNNACNLLISTLEGGEVEFTGDAEGKKQTVTAWAEFWKGYAYMRLSSMYPSGPINDEFNQTTSEFVLREELQDEAFEHFDNALSVLSNISSGSTGYNSVIKNILPTFMQDNIPTPESWSAIINTLKARTLLVNTKVAEMTGAQWNEVLSLANNGISESDDVFTVYSSDSNDPVTGTTAWLPYRLLVGWVFPSERLIQDFKDGDKRLPRNFKMLPEDQVIINQRGRGISFGTRWESISIEEGGEFASTAAGSAKWEIAGNYQENALMKAEAMIHLGMRESGLELIDDVREFEDSGLDPVAGSSLNLEAALEELRRERRVGLYLDGLAFYDARRWGVTEAVSDGGGRSGAVVLDGDGNLNTNATINYNYYDYFGVPAGELDFNSPSDISITNPK